MRKKLVILIITFAGFLGVGVIRSILGKSNIEESVVQEVPVISYSQSTSGYAGDIVATKDAVFVAYNEKMAAIDSYDYSGAYQYTILLANSQNGGISLWSDGEILYVCSKYGNVFAFKGQDLIWEMDAKEATNQGVNVYFTRPSNVSMVGNNAVVKNHQNQVTAKVQLPVKTTMQIHGDRIMLWVMMAVLILSVAFKRFIKGKNHGRVIGDN